MRVRRYGIAAIVLVLAAGGLLPWSRGGATATDSSSLKSGQGLFGQYCVPCHGREGHGDGTSAAGFATKPADLTDGRLMNRLPDDFLVDVIRHGGPSEGLSPGMPAFSGYVTEDQARDLVRFVRSLAQPPFVPSEAPTFVTVRGAPGQPIFFNHVIHAGSFQIPCQYCHADARRSEYAGLPSIERCMGCHKIIGASDNPEIAKIRSYSERATSIPWVRVFKLPEFVFFTHKPHIRVGLQCQTCHGPVERMRVVGAATGPALTNDFANLFGFRPSSRPLTMGWCVECHRAENAKHQRKAPTDCYTCHH